MTEKQWNDKLRSQMAEHSETPPTGLWESIGVGAPQKAAGGLWSRLAPFFWPLAGFAAAGLAAVLLLRAPGTGQVVKDGAEGVVVAENIQARADSLSVSVAATEASVEGFEFEEPSRPAPAAARKSLKGSILPSSEEQTADPSSASAESVASEQPAAPSSSSAESVASEQPAAPSSASAESADKVEEDSSRTKETSGEAAEVKPEEPAVPRSYPSTTRVPVSRLRKSTSRLTASLVGGNGVGVANHTESNNGIPRPMPGSFASHKFATLSAVSRNKSTQTDVSHRQDYQVGIMANYAFTDRWSLESGIQLTGLSSTVTTTSGGVTAVDSERLMYLGVPLHVVFTPWRSNHFSAFLTAGPAVEYGLLRTKSTVDTVDGRIAASDGFRDTPGDWVFSAFAGAGLQWTPWQYGAFFVQPGVSWRFADTGSPESWYTERPVAFQLTAGYKILF